MNFKEISLAEFDGRDDALVTVERYAGRAVMIYRTNLLIHSHRVLWLVESMLPFATKVIKKFDPELARAIALVHDDAEIVTGDVQLGDKIRMSKEMLQQIEGEEIEAIEVLSERWPFKINGFSYEKLLNHALTKDCVEAQLVSLADKFDAYGEALHEIHAGNEYFDEPIEVYRKLIPKFPKKFPLLKSFFKTKHPFATYPKKSDFDLREVIKQGLLHSQASLIRDSGNAHYEFWKKVTLTRHGADLLLIRRE